jgi:hypothetical protein
VINVQDVNQIAIVERDEDSQFGRREAEHFRMSDNDPLTIVQV